MIGRILGLGTAARGVGEAVGGVAEVFLGNRAARDAADQERFSRVLAQFSEEFGRPTGGRFDGFVNGLNRLPRPMMALGTLVLFVYAMVDPHGFATRMQGLAYVPEPLWWLLGAVVSFYFGARELHHYRGRRFDLPLPPPRHTMSYHCRNPRTLQHGREHPRPQPRDPALPRRRRQSPIRITMRPSRSGGAAPEHAGRQKRRPPPRPCYRASGSSLRTCFSRSSTRSWAAFRAT